MRRGSLPGPVSVCVRGGGDQRGRIGKREKEKVEEMKKW